MEHALLEYHLVESSDLEAARRAVALGRTLHLGRLDLDAANSTAPLDHAIRLLTAGYVASTRNNLIVPVIDRQ